MEYSLTKIELLTLIKQHNKNNPEKIKNVDKMKKDELIDICKKYGLICNDREDTENAPLYIDLRDISKRDLQRDVEVFFLKQNKQVPTDVMRLRKQDLIDYMELNNIHHYTPDIIQKEVNDYMFKNIIVYNIIRFDNIDPTKIDNTKMDIFIKENNLITDITDLHQYCKLLQDLYAAYENFCRSTKQEPEQDKLKSIPKILEKLHRINLCEFSIK